MRNGNKKQYEKRWESLWENYGKWWERDTKNNENDPGPCSSCVTSRNHSNFLLLSPDAKLLSFCSVRFPAVDRCMDTVRSWAAPLRSTDRVMDDGGTAGGSGVGGGGVPTQLSPPSVSVYHQIRQINHLLGFVFASTFDLYLIYYWHPCSC